MKKNGFTLAELIITLAIIGVIAAIAAPSLSNLVPDKDKIKVLRYYSQIGTALDDIMSDETLNNRFVKDDGEWSCEGTACVNNFAGVLNEKLGVTSGARSDGSVWTVSSTEISIDINSGNGKSIKFSDSTDKPNKVDTFIFKIDRYGDVKAGDALTDAFLKNPLNMNDKKTDYAYAKANKGTTY